MGQMAIGILYGCVAPELPVTEDSPEPLYDLIERWEKHAKVPYVSQDKPRIRHEHEGGVDLLGVWVAGANGEDGAPDLDRAVLLTDVVHVYAKRYLAAWRLWNRFATWAEKKEGLLVPLGNLWLTPCEVA